MESALFSVGRTFILLPLKFTTTLTDTNFKKLVEAKNKNSSYKEPNLCITQRILVENWKKNPVNG